MAYLRKKIKSRPKRKRGLKVLLYSLVIISILASGLVGTYLYFAKDLPKISSLKDYRPPIVTQVFSSNGQLIGEFFSERRIVVPLSQIPQTLMDAFIAAEDSRFYGHPGVDFLSVIRAAFKNIEAGAIVQGGSTITQQVTRSLLLTPEKSFKRKIKEAILAYRIDKSLTKDQILHIYLNQIYLGNGAYGVEAAAQTYFGKHVQELNLAECALLAGLPRAPNRYSPIRHPHRAKARQLYVLNRMIAEGYISVRDAEQAFQMPLDIKPKSQENMISAPYFIEYIRQYLEEKYGEDMVYKEGLKVYTTLDTTMQEAAQNAVTSGLLAIEERQKYGESRGYADMESPLQGALICIEAKTGHIKAMVGGRDFEISQFNRAIQSKRQPGSAFKPIIYAAALDKGYTPATVIIDAPIAYTGGEEEELWKPRNYDEEFRGPTLFRTALIQSRNVVTIKILRDIGIDYVVDYAKNMGINSHLNRDLSLALGTSEVSLLELTSAYAVFANQGIRCEPIFITMVLDRYGDILEVNRPQTKRVIGEDTAFIMTKLLEGVVREGTGWRIRALNRPAAGKTGTTNNLTDAWFIGYTPSLVTGVWVGFDEKRPLGEHETGSRAASPIWLDFMRNVLKDRSMEDFVLPEGVVFAKIDAKTGLLANSKSVETVLECFKEGTVPTAVSQVPSLGVDSGQFFKLDLE
ncbi:MAG TPA: PBP1A family penicillin-binding protein [Syntrophaceae bacterium]|nr:PBP1A family penicillin-binding protein [Syntrophaceae bacterium]